MEEQIDLRPYLVALVRGWRQVMLIACIVGLVAAVGVIVISPTYTATADILILSARTQITLDPRFITQDIGGSAGAAQRQALVALATNLKFEEQIKGRLPAELLTTSYRTGDIAERIHVSSEGDLIHIVASDRVDQHALQIADLWGKAFVNEVNDLYGKSSTSLKGIEDQLAEAQKRYQTAQVNLEEFIKTNNAVEIARRITEKQSLMEDSIKQKLSLHRNYQQRIADMDILLQDLKTLRAQASSSQVESLAQSLAALSLQARTVGGVQVPFQIRFDDPGTLVESEQVEISDIDTLITILEERRVELLTLSEQFVQDLEAESDIPIGLPPALLDIYEKEMAALQQQQEQIRSQQAVLVQQRDLALESVSILQRKLDELRITIGTSASQVQFVGTTLEPVRPLWTRALVYGLLGVFSGFLIGVLMILGSVFGKPWLSALPTTDTSEPVLKQSQSG